MPTKPKITHIGRVHELVRYPIKSMAGISTDSAWLGWHGLAGDRRFAIRRLGDDSGFPWLTASRLPALLRYHPQGLDESADEPLPTQVRTPEGVSFDIRSVKLRNMISEQFGSQVELMQLKHGIFDDAAVSIISLATINGISREAGRDPDPRRFRANIVIETEATEPFLEDSWIGGTLTFGSVKTGPAINITMPDLRCMMINLDPDTAEQHPEMLKAAVRLNSNQAGAYAAVVRAGQIKTGQIVTLSKGWEEHHHE